MSLFDILTEYEEKARVMEIDMKAEIASLKQENGILTMDRDHWHSQYRIQQDRADHLQNDHHLQELLVRERDLTSRLQGEIRGHIALHSAHKDEMMALNRARDLENVEFATKLRLNMQSTLSQLRQVLAEKTVNESLFESLLGKMEIHAEEARSHYLGIIENKDAEITTLQKSLEEKTSCLEDMRRTAKDKDVELVRALAEIGEWRVRDLERENKS